MIGIIPAAGKGTRLKELGKHYSKTILPYKEKPLIIHQIEWLKRQGCSEIRIVLNHQMGKVRNVIEMYHKDDIVKTFIQRELNGLSGALLSAMPEEDLHEDILICLGDILPTSNIKEFKYNMVSTQVVQDYSRWCMIQKPNKTDVNPKIKFFDKPSTQPDTNLALSGVYYLTDYSFIRKSLSNQMNNVFLRRKRI